MPLKLLPGDIIHGLLSAPSILVRQPSEAVTAASSLGSAAAEVLWKWEEGAFSPDHTEIAFCSKVSPYIKRFALSDMSQFPQPGNLPTSACTDIAYSPDGNVIAVSHISAPFVTRYTRSTMVKLPEFVTGVGAQANAVCFTKDGRYLVLGLEVSPFIAIYDLITGDRLTTPSTVPNAGVDWLEPSPDGRFIAVSCGSSVNQYVYKTSDWSAILLGTALTGTLKKAKWNSTGSMLAQSTSSTPYLRIWDVSGEAFALNTTAVAPVPCPGGGLAWLDDRTLVVQTDTDYRYFDITSNSWSYAFAGYYPSTADLGLLLFPGGARRKFAGTVKDGLGNPLVRKIVANDRGSGRILGKTISSAADGTFTLNVWSNLPAIVYAVGDGGETTELFDSVVAVSI